MRVLSLFMHRLTDEDVAVELTVAFRTEFRKHLAQLRSKDTYKQEAAERAIIDKLVGVVSSRSSCVVRAGSVGFHMGQRHGAFGKDEPWPAPLAMDAAARSLTPKSGGESEPEAVMVPRMTLGRQHDAG